MADKTAEATESSLTRGLRVLMTVIDEGAIRADVVAQLLGLPISTVYRYMRTLRDLELVEENDGMYSAGPKLGARRGPSRRQLAAMARPFLVHLQGRTGETADLIVREGLHAVCIEQVESHHVVRIAFRQGEPLPLYAGAGQRALLAFAPPAVLDRVLEAGMPEFTPATPSPDGLREALEQVRRSKIAISHGEYIPDTVSLATPVFAGESVIASLCVAGPPSRCGKTWIRTTEVALRDAARRLSNSLFDFA